MRVISKMKNERATKEIYFASTLTMFEIKKHILCLTVGDVE